MRVIQAVFAVALVVGAVLAGGWSISGNSISINTTIIQK